MTDNLPSARYLGHALAMILGCFLLLGASRAYSAKVGPLWGLPSKLGAFKAAPKNEIDLKGAPRPRYGHEGD